MVRRRRPLGVLPLALTMMLGACAPAPQSPAPTTSASTAPSTQTVASVMLGKAFLDAPLNGATVKILDPSGAVLQETANATDANGFFAVSLPSSQLKDFRVEVSGGTRGDAPSTVVLKADVRNFNPLIDRLYINAVTTLVAAKLDLAPQASLADTQATVVHFLKLPEGTSVGMGLDNPTLKAFSQQRFMTVAEGQGGFSALISELAGQVTATSTTSYDFSRLVLGGWGSIFESVAVEVGKGALGELGGSLMGSALSALGLGGDDGSAERQKQLLEQFAAQRELTLNLAHQMETRMGELQKNITEVKDSIAALQANMNQQFGLAAYNTKVDATLTSLGSIDALYNTYMDEVARAGTTDPGRAARIKALVDQILAEVPKDLTTIHYAMMGAGGGDGALAQWHRVVGNDNRHGENGGNKYPYVVNSTFIDQLNDQFEYFLAVQLRGITLLVEARNYLKDTQGAQSDYNRYNGYLTAQKAALYSLRVDSHVLISPLTGTMWDKTPLSDGTNSYFDGPASGSTPPEVPAPITAKLSALRTAGYADWRLPTADELYKLGPLSSSRGNAVLISEGFDLSAVEPLGYYILSSDYYGSDFWGLNHGGTVYLLNYYPNKVLVVPARTFRVDTLATLQ